MSAGDSVVPTDALPALVLDDITVRFGSFTALRGASIHVRRGRVHALLGENGAGKTTLMRVASGALRPDGGRVRVRERNLATGSVAAAIAAGVAMVHQHFTNVRAMTVAENVALGGRGVFSPSRVAARITEIAQAAGLPIPPDALVSTLDVGAQQRLEIVKALAKQATLLILDEPTASLAPQEAAELLRWLRRFADAGNAAVLITHNLRDALSVADDVTVLRHGRSVLQCSARETSADALATAMLGAPLAASEAAPPRSRDETLVLRATAMDVADDDGSHAIHGADVALHRGEIVGIAGLEGSGHLVLMRALARRARISAGTLEVEKEPAFIPEDRQRDALVMDADVASNVALRGAGSRRGRLRMQQWSALARSLLAARKVQAEPTTRVETLSGGNQQRVVLARELHDEPAVIVAVNPTRGLDVRAAASVERDLRAAAARGAAIALYSSDIDDTLRLASRMLVVRDGRVREVPRDRDAVGRAMLGLT